MTYRWRLRKGDSAFSSDILLLHHSTSWECPRPPLPTLGGTRDGPGRILRPETTRSPQMAAKGKSPERKGWHHRAQDTDLCQFCPASRGWSHESPANGRGRNPGVLDRPAQSPPSIPSPPPSPRAPRREPGRGRRQGREERGREGEEGAGQGGRWGGVGREKKKENIFRVPACGVSVRFGRKCVGYFGAVTWAGGLREAPGLSQPRAVPPWSPPLLRVPNTSALHPRDRLTPGPRGSAAFLPPPSPPGESGGEAGSPASPLAVDAGVLR